MYNAETETEVATSELIAVHLVREKREACLLPVEKKEKCKALINDAI